MSISADLWEHPRVSAAIKEANRITEGWLKAAGIEASSLSPWSERDLDERIARALLEAAGWDYELAEALVDRRDRGEPLSDVWGRIDVLLALPEAERNAEWERLA